MQAKTCQSEAKNHQYYNKRQIHACITKRMQRIRFDQIWDGFHVFRFALYDSKEVCFGDKIIPWDQRFIGCTSINYDGEQIAIWDLDSMDQSKYDELASMLVHEMFHAYQFECKETRWPQDLLTLQYPEEEANFIQKYQETQLLIKAAVAKEAAEKKELLAAFYRLRSLRYQTLGEMCRCEESTETAEGMAEYAGLCALEMLSADKFEKKKESYLELLQENIDLYFDIRKISYYTGAILMLTAKEADISLVHTVGESSKMIFELLKEHIQLEEQKKTQHQVWPTVSNTNQNAVLTKKQLETIHMRHQEFINHKKEKIGQWLSHTSGECSEDDYYTSGKWIEGDLNPSEKWIEGDFYISGYDPMNMIRQEDYILSTHFVQLSSMKDGQKVTLLQPVLLKMKSMSPNRVTAYMTEKK